MCRKESNIFPPGKLMIYYSKNQTTHAIKCKIWRFVFGEIWPPKSNIDTKQDVFFQCISFQIWRHVGYLLWAPKTMKHKGFGHLKAILFTKKTSKHIGFEGPTVC